MENALTTFWNRNKIILKSFLIGFMILLLLIPTVFIQELVSERQQRQKEAVAEVSSKWAGSQTIAGLAIGIPYLEPVTDKDNLTKEIKKWAFFLPGKLDIHARMIPEKRYRGIYQVIVYTTELRISGSYDSLHIAELNIPPGRIIWNEAAVFFDISDVRGLKEEVKLHIAGTDLDLIPGKSANDQFRNALSATLPASLRSLSSTTVASSASQTPAIGGAAPAPVEFSTTIRLKGSQDLLFVPLGKSTSVQVSSSWPNPSFTGTYLPDLRTVQDSGFVAEWKVLYLNRSYPQQWKDATYDMGSSAFGVNLIVPVDSYQQTTRSVKYAVLCILLTFTAFFLIEWIYAKAIHSMQYLLVGVALCIFYTLLLSFSEYIHFNGAYLVASLATIGLITWYVKSILRSAKMSLFIACLLTVLYGFIFTLIQLQDYALLMGSIGLFVALAVVMYFSRKIKWN
jgi:inner membrane protein